MADMAGQFTLPSGTVTFLFTDIEESTKQWEAHPEAMRTALSRHDAVLRASIEQHGGHIFKTVGNAFCAAFGTAMDALNAAMTAHRALQAEDWGEVGPLKIRVGVHTGAAQEQDGDYFGQPLNRVARLLSAGHGGQTLLSKSSYELVRDHVPAHVGLRDLGEHRLRDLIRPEHVYQVVAPGLPSDFPPLKTLDYRPNNLPHQPTPFIGGGKELTYLQKLLGRDDVHLVTLTGPGGIGKTRLALQLAADILDDFEDGVWFVNLAPINDPALVASTIAQALGVRETPGRSLQEGLVEHLRNSQALLLLDNFEQVMPAYPLVGALLESCSELKILVTSRESLHVYGEYEFPVPPLNLPETRPLPPLGRLTQYEAVRLFIERAIAVKPDFAVTNENAPAVAEICYRLDGLPLAIELAAARVKLLSPVAMLGRLASRLNLLTGGARNAPVRHQTLRAAIDWSYDLLHPDEQTLFRRLAVFSGGRSLDAIETVCNPAGDLGPDVLDSLESLMSKSLLQQHESSAGEPRFWMLETVQEYAREKLEESGGAKESLRRHAEYFLALAEEIGSEQRWENVRRLEVELDNFRAALEWSTNEEGSTDVGLRLMKALWRFWDSTSRYSEGRKWLERVLQYDAGGSTPSRADLFSGAGTIAWRQGDYAQATIFHQQALELYRELEDKKGIAWALNNLGGQAYGQGDYERAISFLGDSIAVYKKIGEKGPIAYGLTNLAEVIRYKGDDEAARLLLEEALALAQEVGDRRNIADACHSLGFLACHRGNVEQAGAFFRQSLAEWPEPAEAQGVAGCLAGLALVALTAGYPTQASRLLGAVDALLENVGAPLWPADQKEYERTVTMSRSRLGEEAFSLAWAEGRALNTDEAGVLAAQDLNGGGRPESPAADSPGSQGITRASRQTYPDELTEREVEVLRLIAAGMDNKEMAERLFLSPHTVQTHVRSIYSKIGKSSRNAAARYAFEHELTQDSL